MNGPTREQLEAVTEFLDMNDWSYDQLARSIATDPMIARYRPDGIVQIDPRNRERVLFSQARAQRPSDNHPPAEPASVVVRSDEQIADELARCPVCTGQTTTNIDLFALPSGKLTFINKNLYPVLFPPDDLSTASPAPAVTTEPLSVVGQPARGLHLLQWFSNDHYDDIDTIGLDDLHAVFGRLAFLEAKLLHAKEAGMPQSPASFGPPHQGYVGIIKNFGQRVGGSLAHGHLQIAHTNLLPRRLEDDHRFEAKHGLPFSRYLVENNPAELTVHDFGGKVRMLVPYFMRRPLDVFFVPLETNETTLHHLPAGHLEALAEALQFAVTVVKQAMPTMQKEPAYNIIFHTGPVGQMYVELLPYTQETGGYEHLGLYVCQGSPEASAAVYKAARQ